MLFEASHFQMCLSSLWYLVININHPSMSFLNPLPITDSPSPPSFLLIFDSFTVPSGIIFPYSFLHMLLSCLLNALFLPQRKPGFPLGCDFLSLLVRPILPVKASCWVTVAGIFCLPTASLVSGHTFFRGKTLGGNGINKWRVLLNLERLASIWDLPSLFSSH